MKLMYRIHEKGYVYFEGSTLLHRFYRNMAPTLEILSRTMKNEFPGHCLEFKLVV